MSTLPLSSSLTAPIDDARARVEEEIQRHSSFVASSQGAARARGPVQVDGKFFSCGGERLHVRGVTYGTFRPRADGDLYPPPARLDADFQAIAHNGFTVVRTYVEPPDDALTAAERYGLRLIAGVFWPDWRYLVGASRRQARRVAHEAEEAVRRAARILRGNDDVLALCVGNEIPADVVRKLTGG